MNGDEAVMVVHASVDALHVTRLVQGDVRVDPAMQAGIGAARDTRPGGHGGPATWLRPSPQRSSPGLDGQAREWVRCNMGCPRGGRNILSTR